jgi:chemotaxis protein methyltransferase CheR
MKSDVQPFSVDDEAAFCRLILQRTGIVLQDHQMSNLRDTVKKGCVHFGYCDCAQYLYVLQQGHLAALEYLIAGVTVGESYFFRDSEQIDLLRSHLLPEMIAAKRANHDLSLRVWSAGCSQGQEIFTIALLLHELIPDIDKWRIHLLGTDINSEVVARALRGRYSEWSFRATPTRLRERWFTPVADEYEIHPQIRRMARFAYLNLTIDVYPSILSETNAMDLILCRNVFIYLDNNAVRRCMAQYAHCLLEQGVLMLGASDPIDYKHAELRLVQTELAGYFRKVSGRIAELPQVKRAVAPVAPIRPMTPVVQAVATATAFDMAGMIRLLNDSDWEAVIIQVDEACRMGVEDSELWQIKAKALANLGRAGQALQACVRSLQLNPGNKHTYLMQGLILSELDRLSEAETSLRKTLYLDHSFLEAHYEMGMLRVRVKDFPGALKSLGNALKLAQAGDPERELHNAAGMTYRRFAQVLENEIGMLRGAG